MPSDIEIAQACEMEPIVEVAAQAGIDEKYLEPYGRDMAKVDNISVLKDYADKPDGKLILSCEKAALQRKISAVVRVP